MKVQPLERTDGFVVYDLDAATTSVGVVRTAPKVLRDGAELLARSVTYSYATFGVAGYAGASAAVNAPPEGRAEALAAFVDEVGDAARDGRLVLHAGTGVEPGDLALLGDRWGTPDPELLAAGAATAAEVAVGRLTGARVAVEGAGRLTDAVRAAAHAAGASLVDGGLVADCDVLFVAGKAGVVDHDKVAKVRARALVPLTAVPVTARAFAILRAMETIVVPDFVSTAGPLLALRGDGRDPIESIRAVMQELAPEGPALWLAAAGVAEGFLATWQDERPFGRPLA